jgi:hypothetical protein
MTRACSVALVLFTFAACGDDAGGDTTGAQSSTSGADTSSGGGSGGSDSTAGTSGTTGTGDSGSAEATADGSSTGTDSSGGSSSTTGDVGAFERFRLSSAAGPCPPEEDCDGYVELRADGTLEAELFGDVTDAMMMAEVTAQELADAIAVFTDPGLVALLDGADPVCKPPTDIFESMALVLDGATHDAGTTFCDQAEVAAARQVAVDLRVQYFGR